jgi:CubicO group peptidase (beta-lactamase class C family)
VQQQQQEIERDPTGLGIHGQTVYVDPSSGMVFAKQSSYPMATEEALDDNMFRAFNAVAEALGG